MRDRRSRRAIFIVLTDRPGGAERISATVANHLVSQGWHVQWQVLGRRTDIAFGENNLHERVELRYGRGAPWWGLCTLPINLAARKYELVFSTHIYTNGLLSALRRVGVLRTDRLVSRESTTLFDRFRGAKRALFRLLYKLYGEQDLIVAQTRSMAEHISPHLRPAARSLVRTLPNPVDIDDIDRRASVPLEPSTAALLQQRPSVLFCGSLTEVKQPDLAVSAFAIAREQSAQDLQLVFMGDGPLREALEAFVQRLGLSECVAFLGQQANPYAIMRNCHYGLLTSSREGFPNAILEMMASYMKKIVATPCVEDLDHLPSVAVSEDFTPSAIASPLVVGLNNNEDHGNGYREFASGRSVARYVNAILDRAQVRESGLLEPITPISR